MKQTAVEWLEKELNWMEESKNTPYIDLKIYEALKMEKKEKLEKQLFIGKVSEIIGFNKTVELLKESKEQIAKL
jgi:hypothetical protein